MRRPIYPLIALTFIIAVLMVSGVGCKKKVAPAPPPPKEEPPPPPPPVIPDPTVSLRVSPAAIEKGKSTTLSWSSTDATSVVIDNGVGTVAASGSRSVSPSASTTYKAKATNSKGKEAVAEARVTVTEPPPPPPPPPISDATFFNDNIKDAFFDYDKYDIREDARAVLTANARALKQRPSIRITIEGHCDERGSSKYNLALGDRRATAAKDFLVSQGVDSGRIDTVSYGEERNFCDQKNEACWQLNRRAHIMMR